MDLRAHRDEFPQNLHSLMIRRLELRQLQRRRPLRRTDLGFVNAQTRRSKNTTSTTTITSVTNPPPMYMISLPF